MNTPPPITGIVSRSITDTSVSWPTFEEIARVLLLRDYNTRLVVLSTAALGLAAGLIGTFMFLRKRSLVGDALSHAMLPGVAIAFIVMVALGGTGKFFPGLLLGAAVFGLIGVGCVMAITSLTRLKDDVAMGIVLSVFFGFGVALLGVIQEMPEGSAAGLPTFIYGKTASIIRSDLILIGGAAAAVALACLAFRKEFALLCFDEGFAGAQGWPVVKLDLILMALVTVVTVIGLQAVGLILVIALLIIPPAAARFWTEHLTKMMIGSAAIGVLSGWYGASLSALVPRLPAGAIIVVVAACIFVLSMIFGTSRGVIRRALEHIRLIRKVGMQHLLRGCWELIEREHGRGDEGAIDHVSKATVFKHDLLPRRSWSAGELDRLLRRARRRGLVTAVDEDQHCLTDAGLVAAARVVRNHRLWETYLITHAEIAPSHVDRDADQIEHVLGTDLVAELEAVLAAETSSQTVPPSPHPL